MIRDKNTGIKSPKRNVSGIVRLALVVICVAADWSNSSARSTPLIGRPAGRSLLLAAQLFVFTFAKANTRKIPECAVTDFWSKVAGSKTEQEHGLG